MNFNNKFKIFFILFLLVSLSGCNFNDNQSITIYRFDKDVQTFAELNRDDKKIFEHTYSPVINNYINLIDSDSLISVESKLENFVNSNAIKLFTPAVDSIYSDMKVTAHQLGEINNKLLANFGITLPRLFTAVIPYNQSIIITDSALIVGLNHYLGHDYAPYNIFPEYKRRWKIPERMSYEICECVIRTCYPFSPQTNSFLERMIYEGSVALAMEKLIPDYDELLNFKFLKSQMEWCKTNESQIWNEIISSDILYSTEQTYKDMFFLPAPFTKPLGSSSPGEVGKWIGKQMVEKYLNKTNSSIKEILNQNRYQDSQSFLISSQYNGK